MAPPLMVNAPLVGAPAAPARVLDTRHLERRDDGREPGRGERANRGERNTTPGRSERMVLPLRTQAPPPQQQGPQVQQQAPQQAPAAAGRDAGRPGNESPGRKEGRDAR
jgi:hypothetical protein